MSAIPPPRRTLLLNKLSDAIRNHRRECSGGCRGTPPCYCFRIACIFEPFGAYMQVPAKFQRGTPVTKLMPNGTQTLIANGMRFRLDKKEPLIIIDPIINGKGPFSLVVDTGASMTIISPAVARASGVGDRGVRAIATGATGNLDVRVVKLKSLTLGSTELNSVQVAVMSLATLNRATRLRLGGIIGYNVLKRFRISIDYALRRILFTPLKRRKTQTPVRNGRASTQHRS